MKTRTEEIFVFLERLTSDLCVQASSTEETDGYRSLVNMKTRLLDKSDMLTQAASEEGE